MDLNGAHSYKSIASKKSQFLGEFEQFYFQSGLVLGEKA
jgi:hypothetical protein